MGDSRTIHEEVIKIDFDSEQAKARLAELQRAGEALLKLMGGPMPMFSGGGVGGASGGGSTVSTVTTTMQAQATQAATAATGGGVGGGGAPASATVSSGAIVPPEGATSATAPTGGSGSPRPMPAPPSQPPIPTPRPPDPWGNFDAWGNRLVKLPFQGAQGGNAGLASGFGGLASYALGGPAGVAAAALGALTASSIGAMNEANAKRAAIESEWGYAGLSGMLGGWAGQTNPNTIGEGLSNKTINQVLDYGASLGFGPDKITGGVREYLASAGGSFGPGMRMDRASNWIDMMAAGLSPGTMGGVDSLVMTKGAEGDRLSGARLAGAGSYGFGLTGGLDGWMQSLTGQVDRLLDRGIKVSLTDTAALLEGMAADPALRHLGSKAPSVVGALGGVAADARQTLLAPFQQLAHHAVLADALSQAGGNPFDAIRILEDPDKMGQKGVRRAISGLLGTGDIGKAAMANVTRNLGLDESGALLGLSDNAPWYSSPRYTDPSFRARARLEAEKEWDGVTWKAGTLDQHAESARSSRSWAKIGDGAAKAFTDFMDFVNKLTGGGNALVESLDALKTRLDHFNVKPTVERD